MTPALPVIARVIIGGIFLIAGLAKIADPIRFFSTLLHFRLFSDAVLPFLAVYLPWLEFLLGLSLLTGILHRTSALMLTFLNVLFAAAILSVVMRGIEVDCGCFGLLADMLQLPDTADMTAVARDLLFAFMCFYIYRARSTRYSLEEYLKKKKESYPLGPKT